MPKNPSAASSPNSSRGNARASSSAAACGAMRWSAKRANVSRTAFCSTLSSKSMAACPPCSDVVRAVQRARRVARDHAVADLLGEHLAVALCGIAVAAAATGHLVVDRALRDAGDQVLVLRYHGAPVRLVQPDEVQPRVASAEQPDGRLDVAVAEGDQLRV